MTAGVQVFVRQDQERWAEAEELASYALSVEPASGHAVHARAQLVLSVGIGIAVLRSARGLEPIASTTAERLGEPVRALVEAMLADGRR